MENNPRKKLFICLTCGSRSVHGAKRLISRHCKCKRKDDAQHLVIDKATPNVNDTIVSHDGVDNTTHGSDAFGGGNDHCWASNDDNNDNRQFELKSDDMDVRQLFSDESEWPPSSAKYFIRENNRAGDGMRGLVYNSLVDSRRNTNFGDLRDDEMHYHLHIANIHHGMHQSKSKDVCEMTGHVVSQEIEKREMEVSAMRDSFQNSIREVLCDHTKNNPELSSMMKEIEKLVDEKMEKYHVSTNDQQKINHPTKFSEIRTSYVEGPNSILKNLPMPDVSILHGCAHIPAKQIINHLLALGIDRLTFLAGVGTDWINDDGEYECQYINEAHDLVKKMMKEDPNISNNTRVHIIKVWSDGFEAHQIKANNDFNSLQLFTITLKAPKGKGTRRHTLPFALCFKKKNHHDIFIQLLTEVRELEAVTMRYCGKDKCFHPTIIIMYLISEDYPERCQNTCTAQLGIFTHRWGYSCLYDDNMTPSCKACEFNRITNVLQNNDVYPMEKCGNCLDWWSPCRNNVHINADRYPIAPGETLDKLHSFPSVKLSFQMLNNSVDSLQDWYRQSTLDKTITSRETQSLSKKAKDYLQMLGFSPQLVSGLVMDIAAGVDAQSSESYPNLWIIFKQLNIELKKFGTMPMHMCALGIEKALLSYTKILVNRRNKVQNELWHDLTNSMQQSQKAINSISIDWCLTMSFSGKENQSLGTANWKSDHYLAFTRLSLFHLGPLDTKINLPEDKVAVFKAFKRVRVLWFCTMSSFFAEEKVSSERIDNLVKLFLSACREWWSLSSDELSGVECDDCVAVDEDDITTTNKKKRKRATPVGDSTQIKKKKKKKEPFFIAGSNFLSLLNAYDMINYHGDMRDTWEGGDESYIQNIKRELTTMRHTDQFLVTILRKLLCTAVFSELNENNPHSNRKKYARTQNFKVYRNSQYPNPQTILEKNDIVIGVIDRHEKMMLCVEDAGGGGITLHPLAFDDDDGHWCYNLWYSKTTLGPDVLKCKDRKELLKIISDIFMVLRPINIEVVESSSMTNRRTVICRSWKIRHESGKLMLPVPHKDILLMD